MSNQTNGAAPEPNRRGVTGGQVPMAAGCGRAFVRVRPLHEHSREASEPTALRRSAPRRSPFAQVRSLTQAAALSHTYRT
eukprot:473645-Prymnesium_polylepis.1